MSEAVNSQEYLRARMFVGGRRGEFDPEGHEDEVRNFGVGGAEKGEAIQGDVGLEGDWERVGLRNSKGREEGIGTGDAGEEGCEVDFLDVLGGGGTGKGRIFGVTD